MPEIEERIIGKYTGSKHGPLVVCLGGVHGNEPAGVLALKKFMRMLEDEPSTNPDFEFSGRMISLIGNLKAYKEGTRFIDRDLNRQWTDANVERILNTRKSDLKNEELQIKEILELVHKEINEYKPTKLVLLDLHTTSSYGGIFSIPADDHDSLKVALEFHAPVIKGMLRGIKGTSLHYFNTENIKIPTIAVCFESGQHKEILSVSRAIAAITNCLRTVGCIEPKHVENKHDILLIEYSKNLPRVVDLINRHEVDPHDKFKMYPNFNNFQEVHKGQAIAKDVNGDIKADDDGLILMPLYQEQGEDGFFLVQKNHEH